MNGVFAYWGCGNGPLTFLQPHIRVLSGMLLGCTCLIVPHSAIGMTAIVLATVCWCMLAGMPAKMIARCAVASLVLFFPFLLLTPWMTAEASASSLLLYRISNAGSIALRSTCCLFIAASTIAAVSIQDVHRGLACIPIPRAVVALIVQLINQTMLLMEETLRIIGMLRLRGASGTRSIRMLFSFPIVWMVRMLFRAERTAAAMSVRGYGIETATAKENVTLTIADALALICASAVFTASILLRLGIIA
jgi:energy-coupling factor transporter transmembrane protein EcfT